MNGTPHFWHVEVKQTELQYKHWVRDQTVREKMKITKVLLFAVAVLLFRMACSKSVRDFSQTKDVMNDDEFEDEGYQADLQKRESYYWIVSAWGPCECQGDMATGVQYRVVSCTKQPCHFIRAPRFKQVCKCL